MQNIGKSFNGPKNVGKQRPSREQIAKHNSRLESDRQRREKDNIHLTKDDLKEYADSIDTDAVMARNDQINAEKRAKREAERLKNESGSTKFFRGLVGGLTKVADVASKIIPGVSGAIYQQFAPPGSEYYKGN